MAAVSKNTGSPEKRAHIEYPYAASVPTEISVSMVASKVCKRFQATRWNCAPKTNTTGVASTAWAMRCPVESSPSIDSTMSGTVNSAASSTLRRWY